MNAPPDALTDGNAVSALSRPASSSALKSRSRPRKAPELQSIERRNWLIHLLFLRREFDACLRLIQAQLDETRGMCEYANYVKGLILRQEGKIQESFELFQMCNVLNPSSLENIKQMARSLFLLGRHKLAIEAYAQAEDKSTKEDWEIYHNMGMCFLHLKEYENAKMHFEHSLELNTHHHTFTMLAKICLAQGNIHAAISFLRTATEHFPENSDLHTTLGLLYMQAGKHQQAFEHLGAALTFDPKHTKAIIAAGSMMQSHQDYDVALSKYRIAAQNAPESPPLWNNIAMCFFGRKKYVAAISCLKRANYLAPFDWKILYNLGLVHLTMQQYASAFHFLSAAANLRPNKGHIFLLLAITLTNLEDEDNAKQAYQQAMILDTRDPTICLNFSIFLLNRKETDAARNIFNEFEGRVVRFKQGTVNDLDPEVVEAGTKLALALGVDGELFKKKSVRSTLEATDTLTPETELPIGVPSKEDIRDEVNEDVVTTAEEVTVPVDVSGSIQDPGEVQDSEVNPGATEKAVDDAIKEPVINEESETTSMPQPNIPEDEDLV